MDDGRRWKRPCATLACCLAALCLNASVHAEDQSVRDPHAGAKAHSGEAERADSKAQSGAEAADEARIYTAQLRRCEGFSGPQRETCVEAAKRRLGQL